MKASNMNDATKILILVATVIIVCVLCAVGFKMVNEGKSSVNSSTNNFNNMTSQYSEVDLAIYDGADVLGSEVVNLINRTVDQGDKYLAIGVQTIKRLKSENKSHIYYNKSYVVEKTALEETTNNYNKDILEKKDPESKPDYINPSAQFTGKVFKDQNGLIVCIQFTQIQ